MNLQQLRYARALAECGSFVEAASRCFVTQPTLSSGIAQLEAELGQQLFARTTRSVTLTEAGAQLLPDIEDVLNAQAALLARARVLASPERIVLRIGVSPVIGIKLVDTVLEPFRAQAPSVELVFREFNMTEMLALLSRQQLDFVFGPVAAEGPQGGTAASIAFHKEPLIFVPSNRAKESYRGSKSVALQDIAAETFVMVPDTCGLTQTTRAIFKEEGLGLIEYSGQAMSYAVLQDWAELGIGSAIVPRSKLTHRESGLPIEESGRPSLIQYQALWNEGPHSAPLGRFLREVAPTILRGLVA